MGRIQSSLAERRYNRVETRRGDLGEMRRRHIVKTNHKRAPVPRTPNRQRDRKEKQANRFQAAESLRSFPRGEQARAKRADSLPLFVFENRAQPGNSKNRLLPLSLATI